MTNLFTENWEGAGNTVAITTGNTSFAHVFSAGITHSNLHVISGQGSEGGRIVATGATVQAQALFTASPVVFISCPLRLASLPDTGTPLFVAKGSGSSAFLGYLVITTDGRISIRDSGASTIVQSPASTVPINTDGRIEWEVNSTTDQQRARWFSTPTGTTPAWDSGMVSTAAIGSCDTLNVGANWAANWEAFLGDLTVDDATWPSFGGGGGGTIAHRASATGSATGTGTTVSLTIPGTVVAGDTMLLEFVGGASTSWTQTNPSGWTRLSIDQTGALPKLNVWKKTAVAGDIGATLTVTSNNSSGAYFRNLHLNAFSNCIVGNAGSAMASSSSTTHTAPSVSAVSANAWVHTGCADRGGPGSSSFTTDARLTKRSEVDLLTGGSAVSSVTGSGQPGSGSSPGYSFTGTLNTSAALTWAVVLEPTGTTTPVTVNAGTGVTSEPYRAVTIVPTASGTVTSWSWSQLSAMPPNTSDLTSGATVDANGTIHITTPSAAVETTYTLQVNAHVTGVTPDATDTVTVTVYPSTRTMVNGDGTVSSLHIQTVT